MVQSMLVYVGIPVHVLYLGPPAGWRDHENLVHV